MSDDLVKRLFDTQEINPTANLRREAAAALVAKDAEIARLRACLRPFCFFGENNDDTQAAWEMRYLDRFKDWIDFEDIEDARAALNNRPKGETP